MPRLSIAVVIPAYNAERFVAEALERVLAQTRAAAELIVIDDGSTDGTADAVARFGQRVRWQRQENLGIGAARNRGIRAASSDLIALLAADDLWAPEKLAVQAALLEADPGLQIAFGYVQQFLDPGLDAAQRARNHCPSEAMPGYIGGASLIRNSVFDKLGLFETCWDGGEFISWYARCKEQGIRTKLYPEVVLRRRIHASNTGIAKRDSKGDYFRILKASMDRRRRQAQDASARD